jgi:hypothetical protein
MKSLVTSLIGTAEGRTGGRERTGDQTLDGADGAAATQAARPDAATKDASGTASRERIVASAHPSKAQMLKMHRCALE